MKSAAHKVNYIIGNDPKKWRTDVPTYQAVVYREAYKGIDLKFYGDGRQLEYDIIVKPGADPNQVKFHYAGIKGLEVTPAGDLAIKLPDGGDAGAEETRGLSGDRRDPGGPGRRSSGSPGTWPGTRYGFEVAAYDKQAPLVIDPVLVYSNNIGGSYRSRVGNAIRVDDEGCAYVAGETSVRRFPHRERDEKQLFIGHQIIYYSYFVCKFNAEGNGLVYSTYLRGDNKYNEPRPTISIYASARYGNHLGLAVDTSGCAYITGPTLSHDFITTPFKLLPIISISKRKVVRKAL